MMKFFSFLLLISIAISAGAQSKNEAAIRQLLQAQTIAWNQGDIDGFMQGYWNSDSLVFVGKNGPKYGYNTTLNNYKTSYPDTTAMGKLNFDILSIQKLSRNYYSVLGKWHLQRTIGDVQGHFTLLLRKFGKQWRIVSDHSS